MQGGFVVITPIGSIRGIERRIYRYAAQVFQPETLFVPASIHVSASDENYQNVMKGAQCARKLQRSIILTMHTHHMENPDFTKFSFHINLTMAVCFGYSQIIAGG